MMQNHVIYSDDPQAVEKLQAKLDKLTAMHARMKEINAYFRKHATALGCPGLSDEDAAKLDRRVQEGYSWEKQPYPSYVLSGNTAEMRRLRQRIEEVSRTQSTEYVGWDFPGGRAEADKEDNRLRLYFDEKPSEEQRSKLKCNGFKWAPSVGAWQRQLNDNAIHAAARMDFLRPESGESPTAIQPKRPVKMHRREDNGYGDQNQPGDTGLQGEHLLRAIAAAAHFSLLACGVAVGIYLGLRDALGTETVSWLCILGAAPFAAMGFVKYHGMTAEKFFAAWLRSEFLVPKRLTFRSTNLYWEAMQEQRRQEKKRPTINFGAFAPKFIAAHGTKRRCSKKC